MKKDKKDMKGIVAAILIIIAAGFVLQVTGAIDALRGEVVPEHCDIAGDKDNCFCNLDEHRIPITGFSWTFNKWYCEKSDLYLDVDSPTFETDATEYVQQYLSRHCDVGPSIECGGLCSEQEGATGYNLVNPMYPNDRCIAAVYGQLITGERMVSVECSIITEWDSENRPKTGVRPWCMSFYLESVLDNDDIPSTIYNKTSWYYNPETDTNCYPPMIVTGTPTLSIFGIGVPDLGSGYPAPFE